MADYRAVRDDLGTVDDLCDLATEMRTHGISLVLDLVLNHVAREHAWAVGAREGNTKHREYFYVYPDRSEPDAFEATLPDVFPDFAPGNFTWDDHLAGWVWTTFNSFQWDVNWTNPAVFAEYADIVLWMANLGVEVIRLDAIAFLWKRVGTNCQSQPEVHAIAKALRALLKIAAPAVLLKAEAIVAPDDLVHYLGQGRDHGKLSDLGYHNSLMVHIWSMLASRDVRLGVQALRDLPPVPTNTAWICYLRCHDDIGWAIDDGDAAAVGLNGSAHRAFLSDFYTGAFPGTFARGLAFQANPATGDQRVSGMAASLTGLETASEAIDLAIRRLLLAHAIILGWGGIPVIWMGDEIGLPSDWDWAAEPGHENDTRWLHRPPMDPVRQAQRHEAHTVAGRIFSGLHRMTDVRRTLPHLHAATQSEVLPAVDAGIFAVLRVHPEGELLELFNVTEHDRTVPAAVLRSRNFTEPYDALGDSPIEVDSSLRLPPYGAMWIVDRGTVTTRQERRPG